MSQHPVDHLIRALIATGQAATAEEIEQIIERMATPLFDSTIVRVPVKHRGLTHLGHSLTAREDSLFYHLVKRVVVEEQWAEDTTTDQYLADLRQAVRSPGGRLLVYQRQRGSIAGIFAPNVVPASRRGRKPQLYTYVLYSADRGIIISGYQVSGLATITIPGDAQWLR